MIGPEASGCPCWLSLFYSLSLFSPDLPSVGDSLEACNLDLCKMMKGQRGGTLACRNLGKYAAAKLLQSCATLWDPIGGSPPGSAVPGILQARTLEWVAVSFSNAWKWKVKVKADGWSDSSWPHGLQPTRLLHPWDFPGKSTGVGCSLSNYLMARFPAELCPCCWQLLGLWSWAELLDKLLPCPSSTSALTLNNAWAWGFSHLSTSESQRILVLKKVRGGQRDAAKNSKK